MMSDEITAPVTLTPLNITAPITIGAKGDKGDQGDPGPSGVSSIEDATDVATVDFPTLNTPTSTALAGKADLSGGNSFSGDQTVDGNLELGAGRRFEIGAGGTFESGAVNVTLSSGTAFLWRNALELGSGDDVTVQSITADSHRYTTGGFVTESGTTRTLAASDHGKTILCTNASGCTVTVPSGLATNFWASVVQMDAGAVTLDDDSGATTLNTAGSTATSAQYGALSVACYGTTDTYLVS